MYIYRIEHPETGLGPYRSDDYDVIEGAHNGRRTHPTIGEEFDYDWDRDMFCGFHTVAAMKRWFKGFFRKLHAAGYIIRLYWSENFQISPSERQTLFNKDKAIQVATVPILGKWPGLSGY